MTTNAKAAAIRTAITPYLCTKNAAKALEFYKKAFGAVETMQIGDPSGKIGHAEITIGDAVLMLSDEFPEYNAISPQSLNGTSISLHLTVPDVDTTVDRCVAEGAKLERPVKDQFYGERSGTIVDPFGHRWMIGTPTEELSSQEIEQRAAAMYEGKE
ncbi:MAG: VOC family protein [Bryobacteraceae bacterium]